MKGIYSGVILVFVSLLLGGFGIALGLGDVAGCGAVFGSSTSSADTFGDILCSDRISERAGGVWFLIIGGLVLATLGVLQGISASRLSSSRQSPRSAVRGVSTSTDLAGQLAKLADMHASGVLTDSEYEEAKSRTLSSPRKKPRR